MSRVADARSRLADARVRRSIAEHQIDRAWDDASRRAFRNRILGPLDRETSRAENALHTLDVELARALVHLHS